MGIHQLHSIGDLTSPWLCIIGSLVPLARFRCPLLVTVQPRAQRQSARGPAGAGTAGSRGFWGPEAATSARQESLSLARGWAGGRVQSPRAPAPKRGAVVPAPTQKPNRRILPTHARVPPTHAMLVPRSSPPRLHFS